MELGNVAHKYYLLNIRLPVNERNKINVGIGEIKDIRLVVSSVCDWVLEERLNEVKSIHKISAIIECPLLLS